MIGGAGEDWLLGGDDNDVLFGDRDNDRLEGGSNDDLLIGGEGDDSLLGDAGNDILAGNLGRDSLDGGDDEDQLIGGAGDDAIHGGADGDTVPGETELASMTESGLSGVLGDYGIDTTEDGTRVNDSRPANAAAVAYWSFDEDSGLIATDSLGLPQNAIYVGEMDLNDPGVPVAQAPFASELFFDDEIEGETNAHTGSSAQLWGDSTQYIGVAHDAAFAVAEGTIQFWFNAESVDGEQALFSKDRAGINAGDLLIALVDGDIRVTMGRASTVSAFTLVSDTAINADRWYHLAFTFGSNGMALYLDGVLVGSNAYQGGLLSNVEAIVFGGSTAQALTTDGNVAALQVSDLFKGRIDEAALFAVALSAEQIERTRDDGVQRFVADSAFSETVDGADFYQSTEHLIFADDQRAYLIGAGSANNELAPADPDTASLSFSEATLLGGDQPLVVIGHETIGGGDEQTLLLQGEWGIRGPFATGLNDFVRWTDISGEVQILALSNVNVMADTQFDTIDALSYWNFNEIGGDTLADASGTPQDATVFGTTVTTITTGSTTTFTTVALPFGGAFQEPVVTNTTVETTTVVVPTLTEEGPLAADGAEYGAQTGVSFPGNAGAYLAAAHDDELAVDNGSIGLWFNADRVSGTQVLLSKDHAGNGSGSGGHLRIQLVGNRLQVVLTELAGATPIVHTIQSDAALAAGSWHQVTFNFGTSGMQLFVDGVLQTDTDAYTGGLGDNTEAIVFGASNGANTDDSGNLGAITTTNGFDGRIDEVAMFGTVLSNAQVADLIRFGPVGVVQ